MSNRPEIKPHDVILVQGSKCVVARVRTHGDPFGDCEVVHDPIKPANRDVQWENGEWHFVKKGDFGGYAEKSEFYRSFIRQLRDTSF